MIPTSPAEKYLQYLPQVRMSRSVKLYSELTNVCHFTLSTTHVLPCQQYGLAVEAR